MYRMWGEIANRMGTLLEELDFFAVRVRKRNVKDKSKMRGNVIINETRSTPKINYMAIKDDTIDLLNFEKIKR